MANELLSPSHDETTLCDEGEDVYFSCPLNNGNIISVCAKNNTSPNRGYVKYRYGRKGDVFVYPEKDVSPNRLFEISDVAEGSIRGLHLKFSNEMYTYVVSSVWPGGVYVSKGGRIIFDNKCQDSRYKSFSNKIFDGINQTPPSDVDFH
ncbi:hypothetical protein [Paraburkholderia sp. BR13444]|uniref:hypothetical protein n=1 Tax=Paraburkholderia sp. BR13444 TaxID=3236997 RepID=UPI0034CD03DF